MALQFLVAWFLGCTGALVGLHQWVGSLAVRHVPAFARVQPRHKVLYVVADLVKAGVLAAFLGCPQWWGVIGRIFANEGQGWEDPATRATVRWFAVTYGATDACQFFTVKMGTTTKVHHGITAAFALGLALQDPQAPIHPLAQALLWYGMCSTLAYLVNVYKALRVVVPPAHQLMEGMRAAAAAVYALELCVNWPVHAFMIGAAAASCGWVPLGLYVALTLALMADDCKLLAFLLRAPQ